MAESAPHPENDPTKRRSTRIIQAVPLVVTGVDALGRPFQERTSTLAINCHGCRYQSKHYVLKNMWVTLEVPHPEANRPPRTFRGKITWILRPRTVRELFQIGIELEAPGNVWGIAFPPEDWFPLPETVVPSLPTLEAGPALAVPLEEGAAPPADASETNVRVLPGPGSAEASLALARQVARLVVEAKQQVQGAAREATTKAVTAEVQPLLATLQNQLGSVAQKAVQAAATSYTDQVVRQAVAKIEEARQATDKAAREQWSHEQELRFKEAQEQLAAHTAQTLEAQRAAFEKQLEGRLGPSLGKVNELDRELAASVENAEARLEQLRQKTEESIKAASSRLQEVIEGRVEGAGARLELLEKAAQRLDDAIAGAIAQAETGWRARLGADFAAVGTRWNEMVETSLESEARQAAERLARHAQASIQEVEQELSGRASVLRQSLEQAESTLGTLRAGLESELARLGAELEQRLAPQLDRANELLKKLTEGQGQAEETFRAQHERLQQTAAQAESTLGALRAGFESETARVKASLQETQQAANRVEEQAARSRASGEELERRLETILARASTEFNRRAEGAVAGMAERLQPMVEAAGQQTVARLGAELEQRLAPQLDRANELLKKLTEGQGQAEETFRAQHERLQQTAAQAESALGALRAGFESETARVKASLQETQQAATRVEEQAARLGALSRASGEELERRLEAILARASTEFNRRAESAVAGMAERLQPVVEAAGQQTVARLGAELEQRLAPQLDRANELLKKLTEGQGQAEEVFRAHHERLQEGLAKAELEALSRVQRTLSRFEKEFEEAGRAATSRWLAELDEKTTDTTHTTYEALFKASQWYEKKIQTQMQSALEKGLEQAANSLRDKAGEISGLFASELNHYSRSYVEHTQSQMDEAVKEAGERVRRRLAETTETTTATFEGDIQRAAQREFERLSGSVANVSEQTTSQLEMHAAQVRSRIDAESRQFLAEFRKSMTETVQQGVTQARQELEAQLAPMKEAWRAEREAQEQKLQMNVARVGEESLEAYKQRLENASNSWLVATVTTLTRQSQDAIGTLAESAERRLRDTCSQVFADVGEALRQRLLDLSDLARRAAPPPQKK